MEVCVGESDNLTFSISSLCIGRVKINFPEWELNTQPSRLHTISLRRNGLNGGNKNFEAQKC